MKNVPDIVVLVATAVLFFTLGMFFGPTKIVSTHEIIPGDSVPYRVDVPVPVYVDRELPGDTVFKDVDTAAILLAFFSKYYYADTLMNDSSAFIYLSETISENRVLERNLMFQNRKVTAINTTTVIQDSRPLKIYGGVLLGKDIIVPNAQLHYKKFTFSMGYNIQQPGVVFGVGYRLW